MESFSTRCKTAADCDEMGAMCAHSTDLTSHVTHACSCISHHTRHLLKLVTSSDAPVLFMGDVAEVARFHAMPHNVVNHACSAIEVSERIPVFSFVPQAFPVALESLLRYIISVCWM